MRIGVLVIALLIAACSSRTDRVQSQELERVVVDERFDEIAEGATGTALFREYVGPAHIPPTEVFEIPDDYEPRESALNDPDLLQSWLREISPTEACVMNLRTAPAAAERAPTPQDTVLQLTVACQLAE